MKQIVALFGLLFFVPIAGASCADVSGKFEGWCTEPGGRTALYKFEIAQNGCEFVSVKTPFFRDQIQIGEDFGEPVTYSDGAYLQAKGSYSNSMLVTEVRMVSARGEEILETTEFAKANVNGIDYLDFNQRLSGAVSFSVTCRIPSK